MTIRLKTVCPEQIGELPDGAYTVPDGCTAAEALRACMAAAGLEPEDVRAGDEAIRQRFVYGG